MAFLISIMVPSEDSIDQIRNYPAESLMNKCSKSVNFLQPIFFFLFLSTRLSKTINLKNLGFVVVVVKFQSFIPHSFKLNREV